MFVIYFAEHATAECAGPFSIFTDVWGWRGYCRCNESVWMIPGTVS